MDDFAEFIGVTLSFMAFISLVFYFISKLF